ncbi:MFS transporter [Rhodovibrionaceae bacterium A322]
MSQAQQAIATASGKGQQAAQTDDGQLTFLRLAPFMLGLTLVGADSLVISPLLPDIARNFAVPTGDMGAMVAVYGLVLAATAPLAGLLSDIFSRVLMLRLSLLLFALAGIGSALSTSYEELLLARGITGLAVGAYLPNAYAYVGDMSAYEQRAKFMGWLASGWSIALILGVPFGALAGQYLGWRWAFGLLAILSAGVALLLFVLKLARRKNRGNLPLSSPWSLFREGILAPGALPLLGANLLNMFSFYTVYIYLGSHLRDLFDLTASQAGFFVLFYGLGLTGATLGARAIDLLGKEKALKLCLLLLSGLLLTIPLLPALWMIAIALLFWGWIQGSALICLTTLATACSEQARGSVLAMMSCTTYLGVTIAGVMGPVMEHQGLSLLGFFGAGACLGAWLLFKGFFRHRAKT